jgi:hypothetical protein
MARTGTFRYSVDAGVDRAAAIRLFSDFSRHAELHPLIVEVREVRPAPEGVVRRYKIEDRMPLGPFHFSITYTADVLRVAEDRIVTVARQRPATTVHNETRLSLVAERLRADVEITLTAPTLLFRYAFRQAERAHTEFAARLAKALNA